MGEEPVVGMGGDNIRQYQKAAKQGHDKDDGDGTPPCARVSRG
jgi:hypothetical protein